MPFQLNFDYLLSYDPGAQGVSLDVTLKLRDDSVTIPAKVDSGAGGSVFARQYGEQLGLQIDNGYRQWFSTATGRFLTFGHEVTVDIAGIEFNAQVFFAEDESIQRNVIGRFGGLDHLRVGLVDYEGKLYLSKYGDE
ncbi:MAG: aspartyl protease family protein [Blastocatellia bacterium]